MLAECSQVVVPEASELAMRYYNSSHLLWILSQAWALVVPLLFLLRGFTGTLATLAKKTSKNWFGTIAIYLVLFFALYQLLNLPLDFYSNYVRPHDYGLSSQTLSRWLSNYGKGFLVLLISALAFIWIFYLLIKKSPRRWWFYSSLVSIAIAFFMLFIQPLWIDPLFNDFGPMKNKQLEQQILDLAAKAGIENGRVFEVNKSQDTKMLNAYVTGLSASNRIVLWDTTIAQLKPNELLFVMGHEMGHYVLHHIWWDLLYTAALSFLGFYLLYRISTFLLQRYHTRFGFRELSSIASLPLFLLLIGCFQFLTLPLNNCVSRKMEHEADRFGLEITQNNKAAAEAFVALQQENLANPRPGPLYQFWRSSHPPLGSRIDFANNYCPWKQQEPLKYGKYFKSS